MFSGGYEWIIFLLIALLLFGKRLPGAMRSVGQSITEFKRGMNEPTDDSSEKHVESSDNA
ncbi:MAG: twin-arginine translocase TatA/TatE family subunit [Planctomycetaceae bacterium]